MKKLEIKKVLLDTSFFVRNNFDFENRNFQKIKNLSLTKEFEFWITEVIQGEILGKLKDLAVDLEKKLFQFERKCPNTFIDFESESKLSSLKDEICYDNLVNAFFNYLKLAEIKIVEFYHAQPKEVFHLYFNGKHPFKLKKNEFPDAFSLSMFNSIANEGITVARDNDFNISDYENISMNFKTIEDFFDYTNKMVKDKYSIVRKIYNKNKDKIIDKIKTEFPHFTFLNFESNYFENIQVTDFSFWREDVINIEKGSFLIEIEGSVWFTVDLHNSKKDEIVEYSTNHILEYLIEFSFENLETYEIVKIYPNSNLDTVVAIGNYPD